MELPGTHFQACDSADLSQFLEEICEKCIHLEHCTILAHAGAYGGALEWREVDGRLVCIRQDTGAELRVDGATDLTRDDSVAGSILSLVGVVVDEAIVAAWDDDQYWKAVDWAGAGHLAASDNDDVEVQEMPAFLEQYHG